MKLTADYGHVETWRYVKLRAFRTMIEYGFNNANQFNSEEQHSALHGIVEINDHKGDLTVYWSHIPDPIFISIVNEAWDSFDQGSVKHILVEVSVTEIKEII